MNLLCPESNIRYFLFMHASAIGFVGDSACNRVLSRRYFLKRLRRTHYFQSWAEVFFSEQRRCREGWDLQRWGEGASRRELWPMEGILSQERVEKGEMIVPHQIDYKWRSYSSHFNSKFLVSLIGVLRSVLFLMCLSVSWFLIYLI